MAKVKALWTISGSYGTKFAGDEFTVTQSVAEQLKKTGSVEILNDTDEDETEKKAAKEEVKEKAVVKDNTNTGTTEKKQITKPGTTKK